MFVKVTFDSTRYTAFVTLLPLKVQMVSKYLVKRVNNSGNDYNYYYMITN